MNRNEFMEELEKLLADLSEGERQEAVSYYEDYFDDAGPEAEQEVIRALGSPEKVAASIKAGLQGIDQGEFSETGYRTENDNKKDELINSGMTDEERGFHKKKTMSVSKIILIVLACIILIPILAPFVTGIGGLLIGIISVLAVILFGILIAGIIVALAGLILFIVGIVQLFLKPVAGIFCTGLGMILAGAGALLAVLGVWIVMKILPPAIRGIVNGCKKLFGRKQQ